MISAKIYAIYARPGDVESVIAVKDGFSWFAFFVPFLWMLYRRMWAVTALLFLLNVTIMVLADAKIANPEIWFAVHIIIMLICGFEGNGWLEKSLLKRGYKLKDIIVSRDEFRAKYKFFRKELKTA